MIDAQGRVFPARVFGNRLVWQSEPPQQAASYELELHSQRSEHQVCKQSSQLAWRPLFEPPKPLPAGASSRPGLVLEVYQGTEIDQRLHPGLPRFLHSKLVKQLDFPNLSTLLPEPSSNYALRVRGRLHCPTGGRYWFRLESDDGAGLAIDRSVVIDADYPRAFDPEDGVVA